MTEKQKEIIIKSLTWFISLFIIIFIGISKIFAWTSDNGITYEAVGYITENTEITLDVTYETESGAPLPLAPDALVYTQLSALNIFVNNYNFVSNRRYQLEIDLTGMEITNANSYKVYANTSTTQTECLISYDDSIFEDPYPRWDFECPVDTSSIYIRIYNNTNSAITSYGNFGWHFSHLWYSNQRININNQSSQDIINNNNHNTQDIIDNQNQNTQDIIDNQNQNTQDIIDNQNKNLGTKCIKDLSSNLNFLKLHFNNYMSTASISSSSNFEGAYIDVSNLHGYYINLSFDNSLKLAKYAFTSSTLLNNATTISVFSGQKNDAPYSYTNILIPDNATYLLLETHYQTNLIGNANLQHITIELTEEICTNKLDEQNKTSKGILGKLGDLFNNLFSNENADISGLDNMVGWLPPGPVDSIINLPLSLFNSLINTLSGTCTSVQLNLPFVNQILTLPCFDIFMSQHLTGFNTIWNWVGVTVSVFILYRYLLNLYKWIDDTLTMRENNLPGYYDDNMWGGA